MIIVSRTCFAFSSRSHLRKLATIYASACCSSTSLPFPTYSLNSLDREGVRLLSPRDSQITSKPDAGTDDTIPDDALELKWEFDEDSRCYYVSFPDDQ